jgi:hypothetical protein
MVMVTALFKRKKVPKRPVAAGQDATIEDFVADVDEKMRAPGSGHNRGEFRTVRILARSAASKGNKAVWDKLELLKSRDVKVMAVFAAFRNAKDQSNTLDRYSEIFGPDAAMSNLRIGRFRRSKKLVEQVQFGETAVWDETMDAGQSASTPLKASRVKPGDLALSAAKLSFEMVWAISDELKLADAKPRSGKARKK